jgi:S-formylglutathione hydrolase FrmB
MSDRWAWRRLCAPLLILIAATLAMPAFAGTVIAREFHSAALDRQWTYAVYLPSGYDTSNLRYPVLYLLHGNAGSLYDWVNLGHIQATADAMIAAGDMPPAIIVMPDAGTSWFVDRKEKMETAVIGDLIPDVERNFRAVVARNGRLIGGLSMGGYGALRFSLKYPEMFAAAALLSPAIYDPVPPENSSARRVAPFASPEFDAEVWKSLNYPTLWDAYLAKKTPVPMYINSGDDDDFFIEGEAVKLYSLLRRNKQPAELRIVNGAHVWSVWESTIGDAMRYIFRFATRPMPVEPAPTKSKK